jgi:hypothetical protein
MKPSALPKASSLPEALSQLDYALELLRRGVKVMNRAEWLPGETAEEWTDTVGMFSDSFKSPY